MFSIQQHQAIDFRFLQKLTKLGGIFFCLTDLKGVYDENLKWLVNKGLLLRLLNETSRDELSVYS